MLLTVTISAIMALAPAMQANASQQEQQTAEQPTQAQEADAEHRVRCRYEQFVNTRIPQRVCRTEAEWARIAEENRLAQANNRRNGGTRGEGGAMYGAENTGGL